jgi:2-alkyl-3-oxoalkanoate reductase
MSGPRQTILVLDDQAQFIAGHLMRALEAEAWAHPLSSARLGIDTTDRQTMLRSLEGVAAVVNCVTGRNASILDSARALFQAAASMPTPPRVVHLSSLAVYGDARGDVDEETALDQRRSPYGEARLRAERLADPAVPSVMLRHGLLYGPGSLQWTLRIGDLLVSRRLGDLGPNGNGYCNLVYIDDLVQAVLCALRLPGIAGRTFNLSLPQPPTWNEYLAALAGGLGALPLVRISQSRLAVERRLVAPPLKLLEFALAKVSPGMAGRLPQAIPPSLCDAFSQTIRMRTHAAETTLGMRWTPLERGIGKSADWYARVRRRT